MSIPIELKSTELDRDELAALTVQFRNALRASGAELQEQAACADESLSADITRKGDPITVGTILLAFITTGTATVLLNVIRATLDRGIDVTFKVGGHEITARNLQPEEYNATLRLLETLQ